MGLFGPRRSTPAPPPPSLAAARTAPQSIGLMGAGALALAGITSDPYVASPVTRGQAMSVPSLNAGVQKLTNLAGQLPLTASSGVGVSDDTATFLDVLDPAVPSTWTRAKTIEAMICHGVAYWLVTSRYATKFPRTIEYVDVELVTEHEVARKLDHYTIAGEQKDWSPADVIKFPGVLPGILSAGAASIRTALANLHATRKIAESPAPHMYLVDDDGAEPLEADEAAEYLQALKDAVDTNGSAYLAGLKIIQNGWNARELQLVEARNADAVEMARLLGLHSDSVNAPTQGSSLTYSNLADKRRDDVTALASWANVVEGRLSMPDVTPRGTVVKFDSASFVDQVTPATAPTPAAKPPPSESPA